MSALLWKMVVTYRTEAGDLDVEHEIEEIEDAHDIVERGPNWNAIVEIRITLARPSEAGLVLCRDDVVEERA